MKRKSTFFALFVASLLYRVSVFAETMTEGKITYDISMSEMAGMDDEAKQRMMAYLPTESMLIFKGEKSRSEMKSTMGTTATISDINSGKVIMLTDMMGRKNYRELPVMEPKNPDGDKKPEIKYMDESKTIAGYTCKKAIMTVKDDRSDETVEMEIWYTDEIRVPVQGNPKFKGLKGVAMEFDMNNRGMSMHMKAKKVEKITVSDELFSIPPDFTKAPDGGPGRNPR